jgi:5,10-methylenetetrahydromethanopterin reductase
LPESGEGLARVGGSWTSGWCTFTVATDSAEAKRAAGSLVAVYISAILREQIERHGIDLDTLAPVLEAMGAGKIGEALDALPPGVADALSVAGTPEECIAKMRTIADTGVNHMILCVTDPTLVKTFTGRDVDVPDVQGQLKMIAGEIMPAFN